MPRRKKAAEQGLCEGQYHLALRYFKGEGMEENHKLAAEWNRKAAAHEDDEPVFCRGPFSCAHPALAEERAGAGLLGGARDCAPLEALRLCEFVAMSKHRVGVRFTAGPNFKHR